MVKLAKVNLAGESSAISTHGAALRNPRTDKRFIILAHHRLEYHSELSDRDSMRRTKRGIAGSLGDRPPATRSNHHDLEGTNYGRSSKSPSRRSGRSGKGPGSLGRIH